LQATYYERETSHEDEFHRPARLLEGIAAACRGAPDTGERRPARVGRPGRENACECTAGAHRHKRTSVRVAVSPAEIRADAGPRRQAQEAPGERGLGRQLSGAVTQES